jgi:hypothetical protein
LEVAALPRLLRRKKAILPEKAGVPARTQEEEAFLRCPLSFGKKTERELVQSCGVLNAI